MWEVGVGCVETARNDADGEGYDVGHYPTEVTVFEVINLGPRCG